MEHIEYDAGSGAHGRCLQHGSTHNRDFFESTGGVLIDASRPVSTLIKERDGKRPEGAARLGLPSPTNSFDGSSSALTSRSFSKMLFIAPGPFCMTSHASMHGVARRLLDGGHVRLPMAFCRSLCVKPTSVSGAQFFTKSFSRR